MEVPRLQLTNRYMIEDHNQMGTSESVNHDRYNSILTTSVDYQQLQQYQANHMYSYTQLREYFKRLI